MEKIIKFNLILLLLLTIVLFQNCKEDSPNSPDENKSVTIKGKVFNNLNQPISGATVKVGEKSTLTDGSGNYVLYELPSGAIHLEVEKENYVAFITDFEVQDLERIFDVKMISAPILAPNISVDNSYQKVRIKFNFFNKPLTFKEFVVYRSNSFYGSYERIASTSNDLFEDNNVNIDTFYYYKVSIINIDQIEGEKSNIITCKKSQSPYFSASNYIDFPFGRYFCIKGQDVYYISGTSIMKYSFTSNTSETIADFSTLFISGYFYATMEIRYSNIYIFFVRYTQQSNYDGFFYTFNINSKTFTQSFYTPSCDGSCLFNFNGNIYLQKWDYNIYDYIYSISSNGSKIDSSQIGYDHRDNQTAEFNGNLYSIRRVTLFYTPKPGEIFKLNSDYSYSTKYKFQSETTNIYHLPETIKSDGQNIWVYNSIRTLLYKLNYIDSP